MGEAPAVRRPAWFGPLRPSPKFVRAVLAVADAGTAATRGRRWLPAAVAVGVFPLLVGYWLALWPMQVVTGLLLAGLLLPCVLTDTFGRAAAVVAVTIGSHSVAAIAVSALDPPGAARALRGSADYWEQTWRWVRTGEDVEYRSGVWLPTHLMLLIAVPLTGYTSFGALPLARGVQELDLMNFYVGQLLRVSESSTMAVLLGWHPWSFVRGLAYTFLIFEATSWSLERMTGRRLTTARRRRVRLACGVALAALDAVAKVLLAPVIQQALNANLSPGLPADSVP